MKRRDFLSATCLAGLGTLSNSEQSAGKGIDQNRQYFELSQYSIKSPDQQKQVLDFLKDAAIPALNRIGIRPVGVFKMMEGDSSDLYVLLPHQTLESVAAASLLVSTDAEYNKAGASLLNTSKTETPYQLIESSLMLAFEGMPRLEVPSKAESRVFQLRIYQSHTPLAGMKKVEMFNSGGEIAIFREAGMTPVFFGQALVGSKLPNLTYMLGFDDMDAQKKAWDNFRVHPGWLKLKANPYYKDTVSNITNIRLLPASCSQM